MSDTEKEKYPSSKICGGYIKDIPFKEAFTMSMEKATKEEIELIKKLPNFDAVIFEEISGFKII